MKAIKITEANVDAIESALAAVNDKATAHAYTTAGEILALVADADAELSQYLPKKDQIGAAIVALSGERVARKYSHQRQATLVELERRAAGWYLVRIEREPIRERGGYQEVRLTQAQIDTAVANFRGSLHLKAA